jgi:hypothetical protein
MLELTQSIEEFILLRLFNVNVNLQYMFFPYNGTPPSTDIYNNQAVLDF